MPTPSTRTPVRIARGSYSNLNGSVSDLQDGEISYAEDQDKLYIKEGGSLVALTYTPASPAFTGTITGVNLTLSGNLTVNGTQTIINTQTLDVEDKHIEIGKVSSPSDTTADGGGIILKASSDKTILWSNATDTWDFNQDIKITSGMLQVLGPEGVGATFYIYADEGDDDADKWKIQADPSGVLKIGNKSTGSWVDSLTIAGSGNATFAAQVSVGNELHIDGTYPLIELNDTDSNSDWQIRNANGEFAVRDITNNANRFTITSAGAVSFPSGTVSDSKGDLRKIPVNAQTAAYTLVLADAGKCVTQTHSGGVNVPYNRFSAGDAITMINNSGSDISIVQGANNTMYFSSDGSTGNRTLAARGMATVFYQAHNICYISGAGLS